MQRVFTYDLGKEFFDLVVPANDSLIQPWITVDSFLAQEPIWVIGWNCRVTSQPRDIGATSTFQILQISANLTQGGAGVKHTAFGHAMAQYQRKVVNGAAQYLTYSPHFESEQQTMLPSGYGIPIREEGNISLNMDFYAWSTIEWQPEFMAYANIYYVRGRGAGPINRRYIDRG